MADVKEIIKSQLVKFSETKYALELKGKAPDFDAWIRDKESSLPIIDMTLEYKDGEEPSGNYGHVSFVTRVNGVSFRVIPYEKVKENFVVNTYIEDIIVFIDGELTSRALSLISEEFNKNPKISVVYGDEDMAEMDRSEFAAYGKTVEGTRKNPYFKPDWSPNAFFSHFYFCNIVAIRRAAFRDIVFGEDFINEAGGAGLIYHGLLRYLTVNEYNLRNTVKHIDEILIHVKDYMNKDITDGSIARLAKGLKVANHFRKVTVVIPSKDNPEMLRKCVESLYNTRHSGIDLEIIVVDNGSSESNREIIGLMSTEIGFKYEYVKSEFNFSAMCNRGAGLSTGDYILFLNDDVELTADDTLNAMVSQAEYRFTGCIGAKLLYPGGTRIQHAGVVNTRIGPVHKLQFEDDSKELYFGYNRYPVNTIAVTAACLMIRKDVFIETGGFNEELRVAFNDIDFGFRVYESGYANVCLNNISLIHRESFSRGADTDKASLQRLMREKLKLYDFHPALKAMDPFYSKYLVNDILDTAIVPASEYEFDKAVSQIGKVKTVNLMRAREDNCLTVSVEYAGDMRGFAYDRLDEIGGDYYIQGFGFIIGSNNACFAKSLLLRDGDRCFELSFEPAYREDIRRNCSDQINVELSGFAVSIDRGVLPKGTYEIGLLARKRFSNEMIYYFTNNEIDIRG